MALKRIVTATAGKIAIHPKATVSARYVNQVMQPALSANKNPQGIMQPLSKERCKKNATHIP